MDKKSALKKNSSRQKGMVDVSHKDVSRRVAVASGVISFSPLSFQKFLKHGSPKGDILETARIAGILAAKHTPSIIPLCHPLELGKVAVDFHIDKKKKAVVITSEVAYVGQTGVEMEALTAVCASALTIYDMMKWADKSMTIKEVKLLHKKGGKSDYPPRT